MQKIVVEKYPYDIDSYIDGKTSLILEILKSENMNEKEIERIRLINEKKSI